MKKIIKNSLCLLLALMMCLQLGGLAMAEGETVTGEEALVYELRLPAAQADGSEAQGPEAGSRVVSADEEGTLFDGKPYSILIGEDQQQEARDGETIPEKKAKALTRGIGAASLKDLMAEDLHITPPEGYFVSALYLRGDALGNDAKLVSLPASAKAVRNDDDPAGVTLSLILIGAVQIAGQQLAFVRGECTLFAGEAAEILQPKHQRGIAVSADIEVFIVNTDAEDPPSAGQQKEDAQKDDKDPFQF